MKDMKKEKRDILLKDLCSRLPYGVKASYYGAEEECKCIDEIDGIYPFDNEILIGQYALKVEEVKPYLFPLSSMTEEQRKEMEENCLKFPQSGVLMPTYKTFDFFNKHHFDYRGLIEKGLAIDATGKNIY